MKYIMFKDRRHNTLFPVMFPDRLIHADVSQSLRHAFAMSHIAADPLRAGATTLVCLDTSGESETLHLKSDPLDRAIINCWDHEHGYPTPLSASLERHILLRSKQMIEEKLR